jgi:hypothetical protein
VDGPLPGGNDRSQRTAGRNQHNTRPGVWSRLAACRLPDFFPSLALDLSRLTRLWCALVFKIHPGIVCFNGRAVLVGDGLKVAKAGPKMPGVKKLH